MAPDALQTLREIVATMEALFTPCRYNANAGLLAVLARYRREALGKRGLPHYLLGETANRKGAIWELTQEKLITRCHLDPKAPWGIRLRKVDACLTVCPLNSRSACWEIIDDLKRLRATPGTLINNGHILEHDLWGCDRADRDFPALDILAQRAMPLLIGGLVSTLSDTSGILGYHLTAKGQRAKERRSPPADLVLYVPSDAEPYQQLVDDRLKARESWRVAWTRFDHVQQPLNANHWRPLETSR